MAIFPERCHVDRRLRPGQGPAPDRPAARRPAGTSPIWLHGALQRLCDLYARHGIELGELRPATAGDKGQARQELAGQIVLAPPGAIADRWARRLPDPVVCLASGWMRVKQRAKQRGVELPLVISDHADWDELLATIDEVGAPGGVDHPRAGGGAGARGRAAGDQGQGAGAGGVRGGGRLARTCAEHLV